MKVNLKYHNILGSFLLFLSKSPPNPCSCLAVCFIKGALCSGCHVDGRGVQSHLCVPEEMEMYNHSQMLIGHTPHSPRTPHCSVCYRTPINSESWCTHIISHIALLTAVSCWIFVLRMLFLKSHGIGLQRRRVYTQAHGKM